MFLLTVFVRAATIGKSRPSSVSIWADSQRPTGMQPYMCCGLVFCVEESSEETLVENIALNGCFALK